MTMQATNITMDGYVSEEVKLQQTYHLYNNTNFFVTFRGKYLKEESVKQLAESAVREELKKYPE